MRGPKVWGALSVAVFSLALGCEGEGQSNEIPGSRDGGGGSVADIGLADIGGPDGDATSTLQDTGVLHDLTELTVNGKVTLGLTSAPAPRVQVVARCGTDSVSAVTDDAGEFELTTDVTHCNNLVVEFVKESFLPTLKVVPLPPPTSPVTMKVQLAELAEIICGTGTCVAEGVSGVRIARDATNPMERGWYAGMSGDRSLVYLGGEFYDVQGKALWVPGFIYLDLRDVDGRRLEALPPSPSGPRTQCLQVDRAAVDQLGDVRPGNSTIDIPVHALDDDRGRWREREMGYVGISKSTAGGLPVIVPATEEELGEIRGSVGTATPWLCATLTGSGWYAWGLPIAEKGCLTIQVHDQCMNPLPNTVFHIEGRDNGFLAETWTDRRGQACLEAARSEEVARDYNHNGMGGETLWIDASLQTTTRTEQLPAVSMPTAPGSCANPETCVPYTKEVFNYSLRDCED